MCTPDHFARSSARRTLLLWSEGQQQRFKGEVTAVRIVRSRRRHDSGCGTLSEGKGLFFSHEDYGRPTRRNPQGMCECLFSPFGGGTCF